MGNVQLDEPLAFEDYQLLKVAYSDDFHNFVEKLSHEETVVIPSVSVMPVRRESNDSSYFSSDSPGPESPQAEVVTVKDNLQTVKGPKDHKRPNRPVWEKIKDQMNPEQKRDKWIEACSLTAEELFEIDDDGKR